MFDQGVWQLRIPVICYIVSCIVLSRRHWICAGWLRVSKQHHLSNCSGIDAMA
jgi:hypothetical protein